VVGLDRDAALLAAAREWTCAHGQPDTRLVQGDAYATPLRTAAFDLVHVRFLAGTAGRPRELFAEALRLVRPGGVLAAEEPDVETLRCDPPHPAFARLQQVLEAAFAAAGGDTRLGRRLYREFRALGLDDIGYRPVVIGVRSGDPMTDYLPATVEAVRATLDAKGLIREADLDEALAACREHLARPDTSFTTFLTAQVWGRVRAP
jgi:SAM-dependent methyltransferase